MWNLCVFCIWNSKGGFWRQASFLMAASCCQRLQNSKLPLREDLALELVLELGIASAEEVNTLKHQNCSDCHHHDLKEAQTHQVGRTSKTCMAVQARRLKIKQQSSNTITDWCKIQRARTTAEVWMATDPPTLSVLGSVWPAGSAWTAVYPILSIIFKHQL